MPGRLMSKEYLARPETFCGPSTREMRLPMRLRLSASGHLYSAIASPSFLLLGRLQDRRANADVGAAAAEIAAQPLANLFRRRVGMLVEKSFAGDDEARRAEAALLCVVVNEGLLN